MKKIGAVLLFMVVLVASVSAYCYYSTMAQDRKRKEANLACRHTVYLGEHRACLKEQGIE